MRYYDSTLLIHNVKVFFIAQIRFLLYMDSMAKRTYSIRLEADLIKEFQILAIKQDKRQNELLTEAIQDLLKKYHKSPGNNPQ